MIKNVDGDWLRFDGKNAMNIEQPMGTGLPRLVPGGHSRDPGKVEQGRTASGQVRAEKGQEGMFDARAHRTAREGACAPRESKRRRKVAGIGLVAQLIAAYCSLAAGSFCELADLGMAKRDVGSAYSALFRLIPPFVGAARFSILSAALRIRRWQVLGVRTCPLARFGSLGGAGSKNSKTSNKEHRTPNIQLGRKWAAGF